MQPPAPRLFAKLRAWPLAAPILVSNQLWRDPPAAEREAVASTLQTSRDDLATAVLRPTADTQLEQLTAGYGPRADSDCLRLQVIFPCASRLLTRIGWGAWRIG